METRKRRREGIERIEGRKKEVEGNEAPGERTRSRRGQRQQQCGRRKGKKKKWRQ